MIMEFGELEQTKNSENYCESSRMVAITGRRWLEYAIRLFKKKKKRRLRKLVKVRWIKDRRE
jgi:hypothetical protein